MRRDARQACRPAVGEVTLQVQIAHLKLRD
jgi:hypothetical protein